MWIWKYQWRLDGWQNTVITLALLVWALWLAVKMGDSFVGVFNRRADKVFVEVLQKWRSQLRLSLYKSEMRPPALPCQILSFKWLSVGDKVASRI